MTLQEIYQMLATINEKYNQILLNAKTIPELEEQLELVDTSFIHVSNSGESKKLQIRKIIDAILSNRVNQLLSVGEIEIDGNEITIPAGVLWIILNVNYFTSSDFVQEITLCETGKIRKDIIVANASNQLVYYAGVENEGIAFRPNIPLNTVLVTEINVTDSGIGEITPPMIGGDYISKSEYFETNIFTPGEITVTLDTQQTAFNLMSNDTIKVLGTAPTTGYLASMIRAGKKVSFVNLTANNISFKHSLDAHGFRFHTGNDFTIRPKEKIIFSHTKKGDGSYLELDSVNRIDLVTNQEFSETVEALEEMISAPPVNYKSISANTTLDDSYHGATIWITANCNITIPIGLRVGNEDFTCNLKTFTGVTATYLTSGTTISSQSDGTIQGEKSMVHLATYSTNTFILMGGGLS